MKQYFFLLITITFIFSCKNETPVGTLDSANSLSAAAPIGDKVEWLDWNDAVTKSKDISKFIFVDLYTDWCGVCKKMDKNTFDNQEVADYLNQHFYPVKFDAERKDSLTFNGKNYKFLKKGRRGVHELALALMNNKASYPTISILDEAFNPMVLAPGYKAPDLMMKQLRYVVEGHYKTTEWLEYAKAD